MYLHDAAVLTDSEMKMLMGGDDLTTAPPGGDVTTSPWDDSTTSIGGININLAVFYQFS